MIHAHYYGEHRFVGEIFCELCNLRLRQFVQDDATPYDDNVMLKNNYKAAEKAIAVWNRRAGDE